VRIIDGYLQSLEAPDPGLKGTAPLNEHLSNSMLGYPDDARLLIINADDFGMCHSVSEAILQGLKHGVVMSTTLMTTCPWAPYAMQLLQENPDISFGVHLTLVSDFGIYRWGPIACRENVSSIVDESGFFFRYERIPDLLAQAKLAELEIEFRAQIDTVLNAGLRPTHLDWHCIADGGREDIFNLAFRLAREYGLAMRVHDRSRAERLRLQKLPANDHDLLDSYGLPTEGKSALYAQLLRDLPVGLSEWAVHPSLGNAESQALEPDGWRIRRADFDFVTSPEARDIIEREGIVLLDYRALQKRWVG
jgi:predicted glycoside hydrolase/deacetylase ChbG (UPF0249 family)